MDRLNGIAERLETAQLRGATREELRAIIQSGVDEAVEKAKGILMKRSYLAEGEAFKKMQRMSQDSRKPMKEIAQEIIRADEIFGPLEKGKGESEPIHSGR